MHKQEQATTGVADVIRKRWSPRAFDATKPINEEQLQRLFESARWAPSCFGDEPWRFLVFDRHRDAKIWQQGFECLSEGNQVWAAAAPILIYILASEQFAHNNNPNRWAQYDSGAAALSICLQAVAEGLVSHQMGGFDAKLLRERFHIPQQVQPMAAMAIGYQANADILPKPLRERELAQRKRKPINETVFYADWEKPWSE